MAAPCNIVRISFILLAASTLVQSGNSWFELSDGQTLPKRQDAGMPLSLPFPLKLFNEQVPLGTQMWVSSNGYISIGSQLRTFRKTTFPLSGTTDPIVISPYRARMQFRPDAESDDLALVSYTLRLAGSALTHIEEAIRSSVSSARNYKATHTFAVSWKQVSFFGGNAAHTPYPRNSFQVAITTDGTSTFALFNYKDIVWDGGWANGGHANTGVGANNPPAQAGINAGKGRGFIKLCYGENILDIDQEQASEKVGQYILKISSLKPQVHGCVSKCPGSRPLQLFPSSGPMFGGNPVEVSDVCVSPNQVIQCQFGDQTVTGIYLSASRMLCYAPTFYANEQYTFKLLLDGEEVKSSDTFYLASSLIANKLKLINIGNWRSISPVGKLRMKWKPSELSQYKGKLNVKLFTYHEDKLSYGWKEETVIERGVSNSGSYSLDWTQANCTEQCRNKTVGAIALELDNTPDKSHPGRLWTKVGPLGWYVNTQLEMEIGSDWPGQMCYDWFVDDTRQGLDWLNELEGCPCTKDQALADIGRFMPAPGCNMYNKASSNNCYYHREADHCVRSIWPSSPTGAGNQCCYGADGNLMNAGDSIYGSTVDKGHSQGASPYNYPGHVPDLSHWQHDVVTYQYCCLWGNMISNTCGIYMDQRPTKDCSTYRPGKVGALYGDGNIEKFGGTRHQHKQAGTYRLLKSSEATGNVEIQAKLAKALTTVLTGIAVRADNYDILEIKLNQPSKSLRTTINVDGVKRHFTDATWFRQEYVGLKIMSGNLSPVSDHSNFTIATRSGVGLRITATKYNMNVIVTVPGSFQNNLNSDALLGGWSLAQGSSSTPSASALVAADQSIFSPDSSKVGPTADSHMEEIRSQANEVSGWVKTLQRYSAPVVSCGMPVRHGVRNGTNYLEGATVAVVSCRHGYKLQNGSADQTHKCSSSGLWEPKLEAVCKFHGFPEFMATGEGGELAKLIIEEERLDEEEKAISCVQPQEGEVEEAEQGVRRGTASKRPAPLPALADDKFALPLALAVIVAVILMFLLSAVIYHYRKTPPESREGYNNVKQYDTEHYKAPTSAYALSNAGSMKLYPPLPQPPTSPLPPPPTSPLPPVPSEVSSTRAAPATNHYQHTLQLPEADETGRNQSYRIAVDENDRTKSYRVAVNTDAEDRSKSYRVAVDPLPEESDSDLSSDNNMTTV